MPRYSPDFTGREVYKYAEKKRREAFLREQVFGDRRAVAVRDRYTQGPKRPEPKPASRGVTFYSPKAPTGEARRMTPNDYRGTYVRPDGTVGTNTVPRVAKQKYGSETFVAPKGSTLLRGARKLLGKFNRFDQALDTAELVVGFLKPNMNDETGLPQWPYDPSRSHVYWRMNGPHTNDAVNYPIRADNIYVSPNDYHMGIVGQAISSPSLATSNTPGDTGTWLTYFGFWRYRPSTNRYANYYRFGQADFVWRTHISGGYEHSTAQGVVPKSANATKNSAGTRVQNPVEAAMQAAANRADQLDNRPETYWQAYAFDVALTGSAPSSGPSTSTDTKTSPLQPIVKAPPKIGEYHAKAISNNSQWVAKAFRVLDVISEGSEVVDAVYKALPPEIQEAENKKHTKSRGLADQAGQYGISGADWKAKVIWENRDKIDVVQAIKNIAANEAEDKLYGKAYAAKDRLTGRGKARGNPASVYK